MRPGGACTACPGFSLSRHRIAHSRPARAMDRAATGDSRPGYSTTAPAGQPQPTATHRWTEPPRVQSSTGHRGTEPRRNRAQGYRQAHRAAHSRHRATQRRRGYSHTITAGKAPQSRPQRRTGASNPQPRTDTAENAHKRPTEPPGVGVLSLYYPPPKRRTGAHRAAHRGQAAGGTETPGTPPPLPRLALPR